MKSVIIVILVANLFIGQAIAQDLGSYRELPVKNTPIVTYEPPAAPRQGGDTIYDANVIPGLPYSDSGTTTGYWDDYEITEYVINNLECPPDAVEEGEPALGYGYVDTHNGGCNSMEFGTPFQAIDWINDSDGIPPYDGEAWMCAKSGWYIDSEGLECRDTDWYRVFARQDGVMDFTAESAQPCLMYKLAPVNCKRVAVELEALCYFSNPQTLTFPVTAGEEIWLWVGPLDFTGPVTEFTYFMTVSNNTFDTVSAEGMSWGGVKSLYR